MLPSPWRVTFVTSPDECNLRCPMCATHAEEARAAPAPSPPRRLPLAQVLGVLDTLPLSPREVSPSTRGEPLLWDGLPGLAGACARHGALLNVTTNGSFPRLGAEGWARLLCPVGSDVKISWGAADPGVDREIMGGRDPGRAIDDLRTFVRVRDEVAAAGENRCGVSLQVAAREENVDGLPDLVRLAAALGLDRVKVNHLQLHFPSLRPSSLRLSSRGARRWNGAVAACEEAAASTPRQGGGHVRLEGLVPLPPDGAPPPRGDCPFVGREAWVEVDGRYLPCPAPAAREGRLPHLGSLAGLPLGEAWRARPWRQLAARWRQLDPCRDCAFRTPGGA